MNVSKQSYQALWCLVGTQPSGEASQLPNEGAAIFHMFLTQHGHLKSWFLLWSGWNSNGRMDSKARKYRKIGGLTFINTSYFECLSFETCGLLISRATHRAVPQTCQNSYLNIIQITITLKKNPKTIEIFHCCLNHLGLSESEHSKTFKRQTKHSKKKTENPKTCQNIPKNPETSKTFFQKIQKNPAKKNPKLKIEWNGMFWNFLWWWATTQKSLPYMEYPSVWAPLSSEKSLSSMAFDPYPFRTLRNFSWNIMEPEKTE